MDDDLSDGNSAIQILSNWVLSESNTLYKKMLYTLNKKINIFVARQR